MTSTGRWAGDFSKEFRDQLDGQPLKVNLVEVVPGYKP
jgi:hypothetical protein